MGGAGFIGSNLVRRLQLDSPSKIVIVDNLLSAERASVPVSEEVILIEGSVTDAPVLGKLEDHFDYVFHLATYHGNQNSMANPVADLENNILTTLKLYEHIKRFRRVRKAVYASAGCTVAKKMDLKPVATEEDAPVSLYLDTPYQVSKIVGELYSNYYHMKYGVPVVKARFQNVYGPGEILGAGKWRGTSATVWRNVIPTFVYKAIQQMPLIVENEGRATRDFIYVEDIVRGLMLCALQGTPGEVYNLASGVETSILELATRVNRLTGNVTPIQFAPKRDWDRSERRFGSTVKAKEGIGFEAHTTLQDGLMRTVEWSRDHLPLIDSCIQRHAAYMISGDDERKD